MQTGKSLFLYLFLVLTAILMGGAVGYVLFSVWDLPEVQTLEEYKPSITSRVYSDSNKLLAEFFLGHLLNAGHRPELSPERIDGATRLYENVFQPCLGVRRCTFGRKRRT